MGRTIAPMLTRACEHHLTSGGMLEEEQRQARRELRALKTAARAGTSVMRWDGFATDYECEMQAEAKADLRRALARLDRPPVSPRASAAKKHKG